MQRLAVAVGVLVAMLGGAAVANAAIPSTTGMISGCYKSSGWGKGQLIVIDKEADESCPDGFTPLNWNQVSGITTVTKTGTVSAGSSVAVEAVCGQYSRVLGGGYELPTLVSPDVHVVASTGGGTDRWMVTIRNDSAANVSVEVRANCALVG
jgi:hypothetical protein